ncbi:MAG: FAD-binding protein [Pseudomonadota bacterium]
MTRSLRDPSILVRRPAPPTRQLPASLPQMLRCLDPSANIALPIRPGGSKSSTTDCAQATHGTELSMLGLNRIKHIDTYNHVVTAECGVRIGELVAALADEGLELCGSHDQTQRTLGGAISSPCIGVGIGNSSSLLSGQLAGLKAITASGKVMKVEADQQNLLNAFRLSYGMLGTIVEATLNVRPISTFTAKHRKLDIDTFATVSDRLAQGNIGMRFSLLPYMNEVYLELRHYDSTPGNSHDTPWRIKDWGESTVLPNVFKSLNRVVPFRSARYKLIDKISSATHNFVSSKFVSAGNNVSAGGRHQRKKSANLLESTWCFPASDFSVVVQAYAKFCRESFAQTAYRCDMPAYGFRIAQDNSALLSPAFDEPVFALQTLSTQRKGWENFALDLSEFAENWGGTPMFHRTEAIRDGYANQMYSGRIEFFRKIRRQLDPENRLLNPYLGRYFR